MIKQFSTTLNDSKRLEFEVRLLQCLFSFSLSINRSEDMNKIQDSTTIQSAFTLSNSKVVNTQRNSQTLSYLEFLKSFIESELCYFQRTPLIVYQEFKHSIVFLYFESEVSCCVLEQLEVSYLVFEQRKSLTLCLSKRSLLLCV